MHNVTLPSPYLIFLGDLQTWVNAKTGQGLVDWCPDKCLGQLRLEGCTVDLGIPDMDISTASDLGARAMVIGLAPVGGSIKKEWIPVFAQALEAGLDIINGLHTPMAQIPELAAILTQGKGQIHQVRTPPTEIPIGTGRKRTGKRVMMLGSDCGVGKKYSALAIHRAMVQRSIKATFRATGQTGMMISGAGIPMDAVKTDFISGAAEMLSPDNDDDHWDVIEGQGALHHPGYGAVTLGILYGSQPDAFVLCHEATRHELDGFPGFLAGPLEDRITQTIILGRITNPNIRCAGVTVQTKWLPENERGSYVQELSERLELPVVDPMTGDLNPLIDSILKS